MNVTKSSVLAISVCLLVTVGVPGQRAAGADSAVSQPGNPESPVNGNSVAAGPRAVVPRLMKFNGALHDGTGKPLSGTVDVTFSLYSAEAGGDALWFETQSVLADELGRYTALLGAMHADGLPLDLFTSGEVRWLGIQVGTDAEQQPRVLLVSVPYALKAGDAETLGGKPASAYVLSDTASSSTSSTSTSSPAQSDTTGTKQETAASTNSPLTTCTSVTSGGTAVANTMPLFTSACNIESSGITQVGGNLGFGVAIPQARLHIYGPSQISGDARYNFILGDSTSAAAGVGGGILFSGYYKNTTNKAGFAAIRGVKENNGQGDFASALIFSTQINGGSQTERMRISSVGNVGIGTSTPAATLDVAGTINVPQTINSNTGVFKIGGVPMLHMCCTAPGGAEPNTFVGPYAGNFTLTGLTNVAVGFDALAQISNGGANTAVGAYALVHDSSGSSNTAVGVDALLANLIGSQNTAVGRYALNSSTGYYNVAVGAPALYGNTTGNSNTAIGSGAGGTNTTGSANTFVGGGTDATVDSLIYATAIGANAKVSASHAMALGAPTGQDGAVNVGIGTSAPATSLHVASGDAYISLAGSGLILKSPDGLTCKKVTINNSGSIVSAATACP